REALLLTEWRDEDIDPPIAAVDRAVRAEVARRFEWAVHEVLQRGAPASRLAAANMLREVAGPVRRNPLAGATLERFGPLLADLVRGRDPDVREAAARTLGRIHADPVVAVPALRHLLEAREGVLRRAATEGLMSLVIVATQPVRRSDGTSVEPVR